MAMAAASENPMVEVFILCSGLLYGEGETLFYNLFKQAWLQDPNELPVISKGKNFLPTIHIRDLAQFVKFAIHKTPATFKNPADAENPDTTEKPKRFQYVFATDHSKRRTLRKIVTAISRGIGTGKIKFVEPEKAKEEESYDFLTLDLKVRPSQFPEKEEEEGPINPEDENSARKKAIKFTWWCKEGIPANIQKIKKEFNSFQALKPNKIFVTGPPACGKSYIAGKLASHYNVPHLTVKAVLSEAKKLGEENELVVKIREAEGELRVQEKEKYDQEREKLIKKKAKVIPRQKEEEEFEVKLPDEILFEAFKWRLSNNDCLNRGFILDNFPKTYAQATSLFLMPEPENPENPGDSDNPKMIINTETCPNSSLFLKCSLERIISMIFSLPEEKVAGTHLTEEDTKRRYMLWESWNFSLKGEKVLESFFRENKLGIKEINMEDLSTDPMIHAKNFVDRYGKYVNYQNKELEEEKARQDEKRKKEAEEQRVKEQKLKELKEREEEIIEIAEEEHGLRIKDLLEHEKNVLQERSSPLKKYLAENLMPMLTKGILEVCKELPEDPVDFLAEFLFTNARNIPQGAKGDI